MYKCTEKATLCWGGREIILGSMYGLQYVSFGANHIYGNGGAWCGAPIRAGGS